MTYRRYRELIMLKKEWMEYSIINIEKVKYIHTVMYMQLLEFYDSLKNEGDIRLNTSKVMRYLNIKSFEEFKSVMEDIDDFGFIRIKQPIVSQSEYTYIHLYRYGIIFLRKEFNITNGNYSYEKALNNILEEEGICTINNWDK